VLLRDSNKENSLELNSWFRRPFDELHHEDAVGSDFVTKTGKYRRLRHRTYWTAFTIVILQSIEFIAPYRSFA